VAQPERSARAEIAKTNARMQASQGYREIKSCVAGGFAANRVQLALAANYERRRQGAEIHPTYFGQPPSGQSLAVWMMRRISNWPSPP